MGTPVHGDALRVLQWVSSTVENLTLVLQPYGSSKHASICNLVDKSANHNHIDSDLSPEQDHLPPLPLLKSLVLKPGDVGFNYFRSSIGILNQILARADIRGLKDLRLVISGSHTSCESIPTQLQQKHVIEEIDAFHNIISAFSLASLTFVLYDYPLNRSARLNDLLRSSFSCLFQSYPRTIILPPGTSCTYTLNRAALNS